MSALIGLGIIAFLLYCIISHKRRVNERKNAARHSAYFVPAHLEFTSNHKGKY